MHNTGYNYFLLQKQFYVFGECSIRVIEVTALLEYRDLEHPSMAITLVTVQ